MRVQGKVHAVLVLCVALWAGPVLARDHCVGQGTCDAIRVNTVCAEGQSCAASANFTGLNLNGRPDQLDPRMLADTGAHWVRAFVDVLQAQDEAAQGRVPSHLSPAVWASFRSAAAAGTAQTILSLKWDFLSAGTRPPLPGSAEERAVFNFLDRQILDPLAPSTAIIVSGNEPFVTTAEADWVPDPAYGGIPVVVFYQRVTAHVNDYLVKAGLRDRTRLFLGAFTRLDALPMQNRPAVRQLLAFADSAPFVDGVDLHTHVASLDQIDTALRYVQGQTAKPILVTEYTYVRAMRAALAAGRPLDAAFAQRWKLPSGQTELDFLRCDVFHRGAGCQNLPKVSKAEWDAFLQSRPWFIDHFLLRADQIFKAHNVIGATFGLVEPNPGPTELQPGGLPWYLGFVYSGAALGSGADGMPLPNYQYLDDLRALTGQSH